MNEAELTGRANQLWAMDIETKCGVGCKEMCEHALDSNRCEITVVGVWSKQGGKVFRDLEQVDEWVKRVKPRLIFHNANYDLQCLAHNGYDYRNYLAHDTMLMNVAFSEKITDKWLLGYGRKRQAINKALPIGQSHRDAGKNSLKTLAPYYLGVEPFWEATDGHDNDEYVLKDCEYTYKLAEALKPKLVDEGTYEFYESKLMPWTGLLLSAQLQGISIDLPLLDTLANEAMRESIIIEGKLREIWKQGLSNYDQGLRDEVRARYELKAQTAIDKLKDKSKAGGTEERYKRLCEKAMGKVEPLSFNSPKQLLWLLKDYLGYDCTDWDGKEGTGKEVLQKLAGQYKPGAHTLLEYRKVSKLSTAFFPSYKEKAFKGKLYTSFNPAGTRTGRLSSSGPNLQQVAGSIHELFRARDGHKLITYDMSAIEPRLIAYYTECPILWDLINSGQDFHGFNTKIFCGLDCDVDKVKKLYPKERALGKEVGLSLFYGSGANRLQRSAMKHGFDWSIQECRSKVKTFRNTYETVYKYRNELNALLETGGAIKNVLGRKFSIPNPDDVYMKGFNTLIQGSASDLVWHSATKMQQVFNKADLNAQVLLLVHDEIVVEAQNTVSNIEVVTAIMKECMTNYNLTSPLGSVNLLVEGEVADTWVK